MIGNPLSVEDVISELRTGGIRVPEIQRSYVWRRSQIAKLLDSIYRGFPTGSILLWDAGEGVIMRDLATNLAPKHRADFPPKVVLDGQQRITSLGRVFDEQTPRQDRMLFNVFEEAFEPHSPRHAADPRWIDVTEVLTGRMNELDVLDRLTEASLLNPQDKATRNRIHERLKQLTGIRAYKYPVEIVREDDLETVTEVFIRVNSAGTPLRQAELALARLAWKLPGSIVGPLEKAEDACVERGFDLDARFLMRALISVATGQSRFRDLKAFWSRPAEEIERAWVRTDKGLRLTLDFVEGNVGVPGSAFLPSSLSLIPLVAVFSKREQLDGGEVSLLRRWFLIVNSFSRYIGQAETRLNQDLDALGPEGLGIRPMLDLALNDLRGEPKIGPLDLERAGTNSPFFPLAYLAVVGSGAVDWFKGIRIRRESFAEDQNIEYHHIFPRKQLDALAVDRYARDEMANLAFLGAKANRRISARRPADYLSEIADQDPKRLESQFVPMDRALWELDRFGEFLVARRGLLADAMNRVLAGSVP